MDDNLYKTLGVSRNASADDIRKAYRKLAKELHPDLNPGDEASAERFKKVSAAYAILGDKEQRAKYDAGEIDASGQERPDHGFYREHAGGDGARRYYRAGGFEGSEDFSDIFSDLFGRGQTRGDFKMRGPDARYRLDVEFLEAATGAKKRIMLPDGASLDVSIPPGVEDGQILRLRGKGGAGINGGPSGDALIEIAVRPHPIFSRDGDNIKMTLPISIDEAVLGAKIEVPTLHGRVSMRVPKASSCGDTLRLKGRGVHRKGKTGDQYVALKIVSPTKFDDEFESAVSAWRERAKFDPREKWAGR